MITPMPIQTNSCPCCLESMPTWAVIAILIIIGGVALIMIPIWANIICEIFDMWSCFINDIKWKIKHRGDK